MPVLHMFLGEEGQFDSIGFPTFAPEDTRVNGQGFGPSRPSSRKLQQQKVERKKDFGIRGGRLPVVAAVSIVYIIGLDMGAMMPCFMITRGLVLSWNVSLVIHSGPTGRRSERSYCSRDSKGWGSCEER